VPEASVAKLAGKLATQRNITVEYRTIPEANHSFVGKLDDLTTHIDDYLGGIVLDRQLAVANG